MHSLYRSSTRGPEDDSVESKHVAPSSHYMFNFTTVVFDGTSPAFYGNGRLCNVLHGTHHGILLSKYHMSSRLTHKCNFMYACKNSLVFISPIFTKVSKELCSGH